MGGNKRASTYCWPTRPGRNVGLFLSSGSFCSIGALLVKETRGKILSRYNRRRKRRTFSAVANCRRGGLGFVEHAQGKENGQAVRSLSIIET